MFPIVPDCIVQFLAWRHTLIQKGTTKRKRILLLVWRDEEAIDAQQLRKWETELKRRPYACCGFASAGMDLQEFRLCQKDEPEKPESEIQKMRELPAIDGMGYPREPYIVFNKL